MEVGRHPQVPGMIDGRTFSVGSMRSRRPLVLRRGRLVVEGRETLTGSGRRRAVSLGEIAGSPALDVEYAGGVPYLGGLRRRGIAKGRPAMISSGRTAAIAIVALGMGFVGGAWFISSGYGYSLLPVPTPPPPARVAGPGQGVPQGLGPVGRGPPQAGALLQRLGGPHAGGRADRPPAIARLRLGGRAPPVPTRPLLAQDQPRPGPRRLLVDRPRQWRPPLPPRPVHPERRGGAGPAPRVLRRGPRTGWSPGAGPPALPRVRMACSS